MASVDVPASTTSTGSAALSEAYRMSELGATKAAIDGLTRDLARELGCRDAQLDHGAVRALRDHADHSGLIW